MDIFDQLKEKISEGAAMAAKKGSEVIESTKINIELVAKEQDLKKLYTQIGKMAYQAYKNDGQVDFELNEMFNKVDDLIDEIDALKAKLGKIKNVVKCPNCENISQKEDVYCSKCGYKLRDED
ncbi:MAG: zinc ribbon domain-containing protein [Clostridiaceae bacterium]|nr:zinc ribbon domain-containing protein [Clostridiaceae bacterium]